jgi:pimeloyl-ACP methyl ester carboxylesterase
MSTLTRRALLAATAAVAVTRSARADAPKNGATPDLEVRDIRVDGDLSRRFTLCVPTHLAKHERVPLLVLLHGLNETAEERMGAFAWIERYGLGTAYERLRRPPLARTSTAALWTDERVAELNTELARRPFRGMVIACPYMPDLQIGSSAELDRYAHWITDVVVPRARKEAPTLEDVRYTTLDGCSLGGHFGLEVFLRRPEAFGAWGGVQTAIGEASAPDYARRIADTLAKVGPRDIHVETSTNDAFRKGNEMLTASLTKRGVAHDYRIVPGPHDQAWLRESGTIEMLLWHDQRPRPTLRMTR